MSIRNIHMVLPATELFAANLCRGKNDCRTSINHVQIKKGLLFGTNGHLAFYAKDDEIKMPRRVSSIMLDLHGNYTPPLNSGFFAHLFINCDISSGRSFDFIGNVVISKYDDAQAARRNNMKIISCSGVIDQSLNNIERLIPSTPPVETTNFLISMQYMALILKIQKMYSKWLHTRFSSNGKDQVISISFTGAPSESVGMILMPVRE